MTDSTILYFSDCGHSPAWPLIPQALVELERSGLDFQPMQPPVWNDACLVATTGDGKCSGFLIYRTDSAKSSWFILLAYVVPSARRLGVHSALFKALVERAEKRADILSIECGTHVDNLAAQAAFEAQGRKKSAIMYEYRLRDWLPGKSHLDVPQGG